MVQVLCIDGRPECGVPLSRDPFLRSHDDFQLEGCNYYGMAQIQLAMFNSKAAYEHAMMKVNDVYIRNVLSPSVRMVNEKVAVPPKYLHW